MWKVLNRATVFAMDVISDAKVAAILLPTFLSPKPGTDVLGLPLISSCKSNHLDINFYAVQGISHMGSDVGTRSD